MVGDFPLYTPVSILTLCVITTWVYGRRYVIT